MKQVYFFTGIKNRKARDDRKTDEKGNHGISFPARAFAPP
jgi:hypothetical protein